jgi:hypothetical protein
MPIVYVLYTLLLFYVSDISILMKKICDPATPSSDNCSVYLMNMERSYSSDFYFLNQIKN